MSEIVKGDVMLKWLDSTGQFWLMYRGGKEVYVASWEGENQQVCHDIIDLLRAYLLTRPAMPAPPSVQPTERDAEG